MVNTAPAPASNSDYGIEKWFWYSKSTSPKTEWHRAVVVKEVLTSADELGATPGEAVFWFSISVVRIFVLFSFSLILFSPLACFPSLPTLYNFARFLR